jgi:hypothetical protein
MGIEQATVREAGCRCELAAEIAGTVVRPTGLALLLEARRTLLKTQKLAA